MKRNFAAVRGGLMVTALMLASAVHPIWAFDKTKPEVLEYRVYYGLISAGNARMVYTPNPNGKSYALDVGVKDSTFLIDLENRYSMLGNHAAQPFTSATYHAMQHENDYRADKVLVFDKTKKHMRYTNRRDASDVVASLPWNGRTRDVFSQLYAMRLEGLSPLKTPRRIAVMGVKRPFTLVQSAAKPVEGEKGLWQVVLQAEEEGKLSRDSWRIAVREEADKTLTPIKIQAQTRFGTFSAALKQSSK